MPLEPSEIFVSPAAEAAGAALGSKLRQRIVLALGSVENASVHDLAESLGVSRASIAHQVKVMEQLGFLTSTIPPNDPRTGRTVFFALDREALAKAVGTLIDTVLLPSGVEPNKLGHTAKVMFDRHS